MSRVPPFDPGAGEPGYLWRKLADYLAARIDAGDLPHGAALPGERALAEQYGVSIMTGRRALRDLRERGYVLTLPAKGSFVVRKKDSPPE